jgi:hypothetical protein
MNSSLTFQKLLYFHFYFDILYFFLIFTSQIYKFWVLKIDILSIVALIILIIWLPLELARVNFGYKGNINETVRFTPP